MSMLPHHHQLRDAIRALEGGEVTTLQGRMKCIDMVRSSITARHAYWQSHPPDFEMHKVESTAYNLDLLTFFTIINRQLARVESQLTEQQMINTVLSQKP